MERKLASIRVVDSIRPIEGADVIECVMIGGWQCVSKKGDASVGDKVVYFEIDSFLPIDEKYEFLRASSYRKISEDEEGFRLRTVRLRGQISQGLIMPIAMFDEFKNLDTEPAVGDDVTELLGVTKWEPPIPACLAGEIIGMFPGYLMPKTDEERIQNLGHFFEEHKDTDFEETVKLDGASMTVFSCSFAEDEKHKLGVCSRNLQLKEKEGNTLWKLARKYEIIEKLQELNWDLAIQGEIIGEGVQGNPEKIKGQDFKVFRIYDIKRQQFLTKKERAETLKALGLSSVPILNDAVKIFQECPTFEAILTRATGPSLNPTVKREGLVFRADDGTSFKVISNEYLLKHSER